MTIERKILVSLRDIKAICFECLKCHARVSLRPDKIIEIPLACQHCGVEWRKARTTGVEAQQASAFEQFVYAIGRIRTITDEGTAGQFRILLEFNEPKAFDEQE